MEQSVRVQVPSRLPPLLRKGVKNKDCGGPVSATSFWRLIYEEENFINNSSDSGFFGAAFLFLSLNKQEENPVNTADTVHHSSAETGFIPEKVLGDTTKAKVVLYEYADYGCAHCAEWNRVINNLLDQYGDKLAVVFRGYNLGIFNNGLLASKAATAAQNQGYFKKYKDLLFNGQSEWLYATSDEAMKLFVRYLGQASENKGDAYKFQEDINSESVKTRVEFEQKMGEKVGLKGTPMFRIDGETIPAADLVNIIEQKM